MPKLYLKKVISNQENLERILDNLKDGIIAHDLNRRIFYFNRAAEKITGYKRKEVIGKDCHQAFGEPFCGGHCSFLNDKLTLTDKAEYSMNIMTKGGESRHVEMTAVMMKDDNNHDFGMLASFIDVTELLNLKIRVGESTGFSNIIGRDRKMLMLFRQIKDVAEYDYPVHISGETGTGKELVALAIHNESHRGGAPFVPINCGALPEGLIESELFGHVKGAFSGAIRDKKGRFELADGGSILLDEIAELPKILQVKLLRFLQDGIIEKVGGEKTISVNVRVISATNKDLKKEVRKNKFREDLFYRLNVIPINIPPLRERKTDIFILIDSFLDQAENKNQKKKKFSNEALSVMMAYSWPGNVRELQNAVLFATVKCHGSIIKPDDLPLELKTSKNSIQKRGPSGKLDIDAVNKALIKTGGNKAKTARLLGVGRATLYRFFKDHPEIIEKG
ncbi:MAG: sigma 54-interacting transcriptional regulator [Desulfobacterales bacterium]|nr:sigma 54-interacting transcriptional regulator [Desulfobacterales bacterium]MDX2509201.1 sigma 54-interacting transcriptional regulator [Desulfobacterales bacterium]